MKSVPILEVGHDDSIPAFGEYQRGTHLIKLNLELLVGTVACRDIEIKDLPYVIAETIMHEVIHALEDWADVAFDEKRVQEIIDSYWSKRRSEQ